MSRQQLERLQKLIPVFVLVLSLIVYAVAYAATH